MTDFEMLSIGIAIGGILCMFFVGIGVVISDVRHYLNHKGQLDYDNDDDSLLCGRCRNRSGGNRYDKQNRREKE